jgi:putative ABC transport system permease protein
MLVPIRYNLRSLIVRRATTVATAVGIALVVWVLASAFMLAEGVRRAMGSAGRPDVAIVIRKGSDAELGSTVESPQIGLIKAAPGVKRDGGQPIGSGEVVVVAAMEKIGTNGGVSNMCIRGISDDGARLRTNVKIIEGRQPTPGSTEGMVGKRIHRRFKGVALGEKFEIKKNRSVTVVGVFEDGGSSHESEVWIDRDVVAAAFGRGSAVSSVRVQLESPAMFDGFKVAVEQDKRLGLQALRETEYYEKLSEKTGDFLSMLGGLIAFCFGIGAMIGASITMYGSIANRQREIGVLRALGFSRIGILVSFLIESALLAFGGGLLGALAAMGMGAVKVSLLNQSTWSETVFSFQPTPMIVGISLAAAVVMGLIGGFLPAVRAARVSPLAALRG